MAFDPELMRRYDGRGPRYTSYPTALQFSDRFDAAAYRELVRASNEEPIPRDLSLYIHLPFCEQACWYCACHRSITRRADRGEAYLAWLHRELALQAPLFDTDRYLRQLHRNFQGYSTHAECDLIGLGSSAIGKVSDGFSQNVANIGQWQDRVDAGDLPIARGLILSVDDRVRQDVIQSIMCNGRVVASEMTRRHHLGFWSYFSDTIPDLRQMARDGLLVFEPDGFRVTSAGRFLLRNVAMLFDAYNGAQARQRFCRVI